MQAYFSRKDVQLYVFVSKSLVELNAVTVLFLERLLGKKSCQVSKRAKHRACLCVQIFVWTKMSRESFSKN